MGYLLLISGTSLQGYESNRRNAGGVRVENIPRNHNVWLPREDSKSDERDLQCEPEHLKDRIIFMSTYNDTKWKAKGNTERCDTFHRQLRNMLVNSRAVIGLSCGLDQKRNCTGPTPTNPMDPGTEWQRT